MSPSGRKPESAAEIGDEQKFSDYVSPTRIIYDGARPLSITVPRCRLTMEVNGKTREYVFDKGQVAIGASEENDLVLEEDTVSRHHCRIVQEGSSYVLVDLQSTNGTFINKIRIREAFLRPGVTIALGRAELKFHSAEEKVDVVPSRKDRLHNMVGRHRKMRELYAILEKIAPTATTVILEGETGTGKEVAARVLHTLSSRKEEPFLVFDCGAVPPNLVESELFGHEKGAFTGASMARQGLFEMAHGGTLFIDEVGELPLELQPKLLRVLEQREVRRVGGSRSIPVDVRIVAATNRDLEEEVKRSRFRQDLFFRLSVVRLFLPPLRERVEDIPLLVRHFLDQSPQNRNTAGNAIIREVAAEALERFEKYAWPGNVRELSNVLERAVSLADSDVIELTDLPEALRQSSPLGSGGQLKPADLTGELFKDAKEKWIASFERDYVLQLLRKNRGNISHAAREADIDRKYFRKLMKKYQIEGGGDDE